MKKPFSLKHALLTGIAIDENNIAWKLEKYTLGSSSMVWAEVGNASKIKRTDLDGKTWLAPHPNPGDLYSAEVEETTDTLYIVKGEGGVWVSIPDKDCYPSFTTRYELTLSCEDGMLVRVGHKEMEKRYE